MTLIQGFGQIYKVCRPGIDKIVKGRLVKADDGDEFEITASIQPSGGRDLQKLSEGERTRWPITIYSDQELLTDDENCKRKADILFYKGKHFEIVRVEDWTDTDLPHWKCMGLKKDFEAKPKCD